MKSMSVLIEETLWNVMILLQTMIEAQTWQTRQFVTIHGNFSTKFRQILLNLFFFFTEPNLSFYFRKKTLLLGKKLPRKSHWKTVKVCLFNWLLRNVLLKYQNSLETLYKQQRNMLAT